MRFELSRPTSASELASALSVPCPIHADTTIRAVTTDSRLVRKGDLFIALRGKMHDGHSFLNEARERGAALLIAERSGTDIIAVDNTALALGTVAALSLKDTRIPIVAITGSVGKTGTKEAVAAALSADMHVHKTPENENNEFGVAYTVLSRKPSDEVIVLEFGTNHKGEILRHTKIAPPDVAIITAVGSAHIGAFGSREAILAEKADVFKEMKSGLLLLNGDDALLKTLVPSIPTRYVGLRADCDLSASRIFFSRFGVSYTLTEAGKERRIFLRGVGTPRIYASLFALATAKQLGIDTDRAAAALLHMPLTDGRQNVITVGGILLIDDAYNASPEAMREALILLSALPTARRRYAVLGDMLELGEMSETLHREVGMHAAKYADRLFCFGTYAKAVAEGAREGGMLADDICTASDADACLAMLKPMLSDGDTVLVKASHALGGAQIVRGIRMLGGRP